MLTNFRAKIQAWLNQGESVQIVAPPGFGKSRFGRSLGGLFIDTNLLQTPQEILEFIKSSSERKLIVIDCLDRILDPAYQDFFKYLKALRDQHKYQLAYVFLTKFAVDAKYQPMLGDLYEIASEHFEYLPALETKEYDTYGFSPTSKQVKEIAKLSGGIPALVKICMLAMRDSASVDPANNPKLKAQLEEMLSCTPDHPAYAASSLVTSYLNHRKSTPLTASETRLLEILLANKGQLVSKDKISQAVYPDVKNYAGVSDHAIDQLVHRLRAKISDKYSIQTHRGLGYKLTSF